MDPSAGDVPTFRLVPSYSSFLDHPLDDQDGYSHSIPHHLLHISLVAPYELPYILCGGFVVVTWCLMFVFPLLSFFQPLTMASLLASAQDLVQSLQLSSNWDVFVEVVGPLGF